MEFRYSDGGRLAAGFRGGVDDCVTRAIAIAAKLPYKTVYSDLKAILGKGKSPRNKIDRKVYQPYIESLGFIWKPTMTIGSGTQVHLEDAELPNGRLIVKISKHLAAVIDGVLHDTFDCSRQGKRAVYGYFKLTEDTNDHQRPDLSLL